MIDALERLAPFRDDARGTALYVLAYHARRLGESLEQVCERAWDFNARCCVPPLRTTDAATHAHIGKALARTGRRTLSMSYGWIAARLGASPDQARAAGLISATVRRSLEGRTRDTQPRRSRIASILATGYLTPAEMRQRLADDPAWPIAVSVQTIRADYRALGIGPRKK